MLDRESKSKQTLRKSTKMVGCLWSSNNHFFQTDYITSLIFRNVFLFTAWADNANACAKQYAGTGALKTDYTRQVSIFCVKGLLGSWACLGFSLSLRS